MDFLDLWQKFWVIVFLLSLPLMGFLVWQLILMERKERRLKKKIQRDLHFPGMEETRAFLKPRLKKLGIKVDDRHYEKN